GRWAGDGRLVGGRRALRLQRARTALAGAGRRVAPSRIGTARPRNAGAGRPARGPADLERQRRRRDRVAGGRRARPRRGRRAAGWSASPANGGARWTPSAAPGRAGVDRTLDEGGRVD